MTRSLPAAVLGLGGEFQSAPAPAVRTGSGVGNSGRQADYEFRAGAGALATGRDAALVQLHQGFTRARPSPSPRAPFSPRPGPCQNGSNTRGSNSGAIPRPLSRNCRTTCPASARAVTPVAPPGSVNLAALASRLISTCSRPMTLTLARIGVVSI